MKITTFLRPMFAVIAMGVAGVINAQIGYQVSLLNNATGEPRANERVSVNVKITDSKGTVICSEVKSETSNDFGVVSMSVGNSEIFANADWSNLPFFIEASVDGRLIGRSQLLSVPVAEHAKHTGTLTKEILCSKKWSDIVSHEDGSVSIYEYTFYENGNGVYNWCFVGEGGHTKNFKYYIDGNTIILLGINDQEYSIVFHYIPKNNRIVSDGSGWYK